ncbi:MAG: glycosyltransferase [Anaerolineae bacterium]|nr:glycosyltransferase [Anaerolineae bacterium]
MRICYVASYSIHVLRWVKYFAERGHDVHLVITQPADLPLIPSVTVHDLTAGTPTSKLGYPIWIVRARKLVRAIQPDILHAHQVSRPGWIAAATGFHPLLVTVWGSDLFLAAHKSWALHRLARWVLHSADYVTCVSRSLAEAARELGVDASLVEVAPWGVDTNVYYPSPAGSTRAQLGLGPGPVILSPRSLKAIYNPLDIAAAIPRVLQAVPSAQFVIRTHVFDPDLLEQFKAIVRRGGAEPAVRYVGDLGSEEAIADLYRVSDVIVSVPSSDGTPSSVLEALACGALPVLSDLPSLREWIEHERHGLFVPVGDVEAIGQAIIRLVTDEQLRNQIKINAARLVAERADSKMLMERNERIYERLL